MRNDDAYRILLSANVEAESAVQETFSSPVLSPAYETVYINGEEYHLYNGYYRALDGDDGERQTCIVTSDGRDEYSIRLIGSDDETVKGRADEISFDGDSRKVVLLGDVEVDGVQSFGSPDYGYPLDFNSIRTLVKANGSTASQVVTYDHPFDFYHGVWGRHSGGGSDGIVNVLHPCLDGRHYACGDGSGAAPEFTIDDCVSYGAGGGESRYYYFNRGSGWSYSYQEIVPYYRHTYRYMVHENDVYSNPQEVSKTQIGTFSRSSWASVKSVIKSAAEIVVKKNSRGEWEKFYSGSKLDGSSLAVANDCGDSWGNGMVSCRDIDHAWPCSQDSSKDSVTQYSWALFKKVCEGVFKGGVTVQTKYDIISRKYPNGSWNLGQCGYETWTYGECTSVKSYVVHGGKWEHDDEGVGCAVSLAGEPWICSAAPAAPGSTSWTPDCPAEDECKKYYIIIEKEEYGNTQNCNSPLLAYLHWHELIDITQDYMSGSYKSSDYEYFKVPYVIGTLKSDCVDCSGNPKKSDVMYTVSSDGPYRSRVVVFREYDSVDSMGVTAEEKISDVYDAISTGDVRSLTLNQTECQCLKYVQAMGATEIRTDKVVSTNLISYTFGNGTTRQVTQVDVSGITVPLKYSGWEFGIIPSGLTDEEIEALENTDDGPSSGDVLVFYELGGMVAADGSLFINGYGVHGAVLEPSGTDGDGNDIRWSSSSVVISTTDLLGIGYSGSYIIKLFPPC